MNLILFVVLALAFGIGCLFGALWMLAREYKKLEEITK